VGDGASTSSWWDSWLGAFTLAVQFPCLLSHSTNKDVSVQQIIQLGISYNLTARLSSQATLELTEVQQLLASITLTQQPDRRTCKFADTTSKLNTGAIYRASTYSGVSSRIYNYVWTSRAPTRVRFFGWLLMRGRLQCRANLYYKHVVDNDTCELCRQEPETSDHLISSIAWWQTSSVTTLASKVRLSHQFSSSGICPGHQGYLQNTSTPCYCCAAGTSGTIDTMLSSAINLLYVAS